MPFTPPEAFNLADHILGERIREGRGDRIALRLDDRELTYAEVAGLAHRYSHALADLGVAQEQRVLISLPDGADFVAALFGILQLGGVAVMVNADMPSRHLTAILASARAPVAVIGPSTVATYAEASAALPDPPRLLVVGGDPRGHESFDDHTRAEPFLSAVTHRDDPAIWLFSGGTTGVPKIVVQTHRSFANTTALYAQDALGYREDDITISVPRLYFGYATGSNLLFPFSVGASSVLFDAHPSPAALFERIRRHRPTILVNVPKMVAAMVEEGPDEDLSSLRFATSAGEALPAALYDRWRRTFGVELLDGLGTAEQWHIFVSNLPGAVRPGTLGRVVPGFELAVRDAEGRDVPQGEVGRLWVRGGSRAIGYWQDMDRTAETFQGEWVAGGDLVSMDEEGWVTYVGRSDDAMKIGGKWLLPADVEGVLGQHAAVEECAVIGAPDPRGLTKPVAFVVSDAGPDPAALEAELRDYLLERLEPYKVPRRILVVEELPRTHLGKINRGDLRETASTALA